MFPSILLKRAELIGINLFISRSAIFLLKNTTAPFSDFFKILLLTSLGAHGRIKQIKKSMYYNSSKLFSLKLFHIYNVKKNSIVWFCAKLTLNKEMHVTKACWAN